MEHRTFAAVYIDDIIVHSNSYEDHLEHLRKIFETLRAQKLYAKASKCSFAQREVEFCGYVINANGISTQASKIQAIKEWPPLSNPKEVRSFLGLFGFYQRFIPSYASIVTPLTESRKQKTTGNREERKHKSVFSPFWVEKPLATTFSLSSLLRKSPFEQKNRSNRYKRQSRSKVSFWNFCIPRVCL